MAVAVTYAFDITAKETLTNAVDSASPIITHAEYNETDRLSSTTTPAITKYAAFLATLTAGALTINLAALTGTNGIAVDLTGLRIQLLRIKNLGANTMTFAEGASNGIALVCGSIIVPTGGVFQYFFNDAAPDVAAGDRTIDVTGTAAQTAEITIVAG